MIILFNFFLLSNHVLVRHEAHEVVRGQNGRIIEAVKKAHENVSLIASVCTGAFIVAQTGLLKGKNATSYHAFMGKLADYGATPVNERLVVNGRVITGAGPPASVDVGMKVVEMLLGPEALQKVRDWVTY